MHGNRVGLVYKDFLKNFVCQILSFEGDSESQPLDLDFFVFHPDTLRFYRHVLGSCRAGFAPQTGAPSYDASQLQIYRLDHFAVLL